MASRVPGGTGSTAERRVFCPKAGVSRNMAARAMAADFGMEVNSFTVGMPGEEASFQDSAQAECPCCGTGLQPVSEPTSSRLWSELSRDPATACTESRE